VLIQNEKNAETLQIEFDTSESAEQADDITMLVLKIIGGAQ